jgi:hypothetical protein
MCWRHIYGKKLVLDAHHAVRRVAGTRRPAKSPGKPPVKSMGMARESRLTPTREGYSFVP